jgi:hypothetical protein
MEVKRQRFSPKKKVKRLHKLLTTESYEVDFLKNLNFVFTKWLNDTCREMPLDTNETYCIEEFYADIFKDFLGVDCGLLEELFKQKYKHELFPYFCDNFATNKNIIFLAFIIHLILNENLSLLVSIKPKAYVCGNWAIGEFSTSSERLIQTIKNRIQFSLGKDEYANLYYQQYLNYDHDIFQNILYEVPSKTNSLKVKPSIKRLKKREKTLIDILLGSAAIIITTLIRYINKKIRIWIPNNNDTQAMLTIAQTIGSIKMYGFCLERFKSTPKTETNYCDKYYTELQPHLKEVYKRIPAFLSFFTNFGKSTDKRLLKICESEKGQFKIWFILQHLLWLITQPYCNNTIKANDIFSELVMDSNIVDSEQSDFNIATMFDIGNLRIENRTIDEDRIYILKFCLKIFEQKEVEIHHTNSEIIKDIKLQIISYKNENKNK